VAATLAEKFKNPDYDTVARQWYQAMRHILDALERFDSAKTQDNAAHLWVVISAQLGHIHALVHQTGNPDFLYDAVALRESIERLYHITDLTTFLPIYTKLKDTDLPAIVADTDQMNVTEDENSNYVYDDHPDLNALDTKVDTALAFYNQVV